MKLRKVQIYKPVCTCKKWSSKLRGCGHYIYILDNTPHCAHCRRALPNVANTIIIINDDAKKTPILQ